jgi:DNA-binding HxlR family transcriptional regulator
MDPIRDDLESIDGFWSFEILFYLFTQKNRGTCERDVPHVPSKALSTALLCIYLRRCSEVE